MKRKQVLYLIYFNNDYCGNWAKSRDLLKAEMENVEKI